MRPYLPKQLTKRFLPCSTSHPSAGKYFSPTSVPRANSRVWLVGRLGWDGSLHGICTQGRATRRVRPHTYTRTHTPTATDASPPGHMRTHNPTANPVHLSLSLATCSTPHSNFDSFDTCSHQLFLVPPAHRAYPFWPLTATACLISPAFARLSELKSTISAQICVYQGPVSVHCSQGSTQASGSSLT